MLNLYRLEVRAMCPVHAELIDVYQLEIRSAAVIPVERILEFVKKYETTQIFQEAMTQEIAVGLGACSVSTTGTHSGVEVISYAP